MSTDSAETALEDLLRRVSSIVQAQPSSARDEDLLSAFKELGTQAQAASLAAAKRTPLEAFASKARGAVRRLRR